MDASGTFLGLRVKTRANLGAYLSTFASAVPTIPLRHAAGRPVQDAGDLRRGGRRLHQHRAGRRLPRRWPARRRPTSSSASSRRRRGSWSVDPAELRRRNFIREFPYETPVALVLRHRRLRAEPRESAETGRRRRLPGPARGGREARQEARAGVLLLHRSVRAAPSAVAMSLGGGVGLYESGEIRVNPIRHGHRLHRHAQPRSGPRDRLRAGRRGPSSASRSSRSRWCTATPGGWSTASAPTARARSRSAARRWCDRPRRSSPRAS